MAARDSATASRWRWRCSTSTTSRATTISTATRQATSACARWPVVIESFGRRTGDLVARYGGEEFALLAPVSDAAEALALAQGICRELEKLALPHAQSPYGVVTISIGVAALVPGEANDSGMLVRCADQALYRAKQAGRNRAMLPATGSLAAREQESADTTGA